MIARKNVALVAGQLFKYSINGSVLTDMFDGQNWVTIKVD